MAEDLTPNQDGGEKDVNIQPTVSQIQITPPQSVSVKNSIPRDGLPAHISDVFKNISNSQNGKESE